MSLLQHGLTPKMKPLSPKRSALIAALDLGTSKVACLIARLRPNPNLDTLRRRSHSIEVLGFGHTGARGMKAGAVIDLAAAEAAIRQAVDVAERGAKLQLEAVVVSVAAGRPASELMTASVDVAGSAVSDGDIARVLAAAGLFAFTLETHDGDGVVIGRGLRYAHGKAYARDCVAAAGLGLSHLEEASPRTEDSAPVRGLVVVASKA